MEPPQRRRCCRLLEPPRSLWVFDGKQQCGVVSPLWDSWTRDAETIVSFSAPLLSYVVLVQREPKRPSMSVTLVHHAVLEVERNTLITVYISLFTLWVFSDAFLHQNSRNEVLMSIK